jgi:CheY-like chemotaxis protein
VGSTGVHRVSRSADTDEMEVDVMGQTTRVLLVDDNPAIREMLLRSLSPLATVLACGSAAEALSWAEKQTPDLIISDYRMPGLNGLELLAKLRTFCPHISVLMLASRADILGPLAGSSAWVEEFIEKPFFLDDAITRIQRVLNRITLSKAARGGADSTSVRGTLAQMSVVDLLQTLDIGQKSCRLELHHAGQEGEMQFVNGQLVHAALGNLSGESAVYAVVAWTEGSFLIDFERVECQRTITHSTQSVLLEALRRFDESQRDTKAKTETEAVPKPSSGAAFAPTLAPAM